MAFPRRAKHRILRRFAVRRIRWRSPPGTARGWRAVPIEAMIATMPSTRAVMPSPLRGWVGGAYCADPAVLWL